MDLQLKGHTALVTGAHRGTGLVIARHLLREGARVLVHGFEPAATEAAVKELGGGIPVTADIRTDDGANALIDGCLAEGVDILINNYGTAESGSWDRSGTDDWIDAYQKNVLSAQRLIRGLLPSFRKRAFARIINLGTVGSTRPNAVMPHYYAAKGALATLTVSLARELAGTGIRVNLVSPGLILTPEVMAANLERGRRKGWGDTWEAIEARVAADIPIGRIVRREEVADLVVFLASPLADGIHGQNLRIDGGALSIVS
jgi:NAD(P)-dependent dehydrogenase (short-subunit alcohol dehydrogenase family)